MVWPEAKRHVRLAFSLLGVGLYAWFMFGLAHHAWNWRSDAYTALLVSAITVFVVWVVFDAIKRWKQARRA